MAVRRVQLRRGTTDQNNAFTGVEGEITVDTETKSIRVHDAAQAGGFDLMRADMSNDSFAAGNITIGEGVGANTLTIGHSTSTVAIAGNLTVAGNVTQSDSLAIAARLIGINTGSNQQPLDTDSIGIIFERFNSDGNAGAGTQQNNAFLVWREDGDYFAFGTAAGIDETTETDILGGAFAYSDVYLGALVVDSSLNMTEGNISNVVNIDLDTISSGGTITINATDNTQSSFVVKTNGGEEYINVDGRDANMALTLGVVASTTTLNSNTIALGTDAANDVTITVAARTGDNDGSDLTISAGSAADSDDNLGGNLILASGSGVEVGGTSSIQFQTKRTNVAGVSEAMRIHSDGNVGIGDNAPGTLLQLSGADAYITLKNTTAENTNGGAETKIIFEDHGNNALGQIEVSHQGTDDDEFGQMIFSTNNDGGLQTALTINKDQKATFAGDVVVEGRDLVLGTATGGNTSITVPAQTVVDDDGHSLSIEAGSANGDGTSGSLTLKTYDATETLKTALTIDTNQDIILGQDGDTNVNISVPTDTNGAGASLTISSAIGNNAGTNDGSLILRSGSTTVLTLDAAEKATFAGAVEVATTLDMTDGNINNVATLYLDDIQCADDVNVFTLTGKDNTENAVRIVDGGGTEYLNVDARNAAPNLILAQATNLSSTLAVSGLANLNAGIEIDNAGNNTNEFTVAHTSGNVLTKGTITSHGNHIVGVAGNGNPNLSVVNNAGTTTFSVTGVTGNTSIAGTAGITGITTLDDTLKIKSAPTGGNAITINSDRTNVAKGGANTDVSILFVEGGDNGTDAYLKWDDDQDSFTVTGGKFNTEEQFSVGPIATPNFKVSKTTGVLDVLGTAPVLTLKNSTAGDGDNADPILIKFQNDDGEEHGRITASQDGGTKNDGKIVFSTGNHAAGPAVQTVLTLDHDKGATFTGNIAAQDITASNGTINVGGNGASIVATNATTLTITEDTIVAAGNLQVNGNITGDADEAKVIFAASAAEGSTITLGGGGKVITVGKLEVQGDVISGSTDGDLTLASEGNLTFHIDTDSDEASLFSFKVNGAVGAGTEVAQIDESGNLQIDGDLTLGGSTIKSNDGTATIELATDGTNTTIEKVLTVKGNGAGTSSVVLGIDDANASVIGVASRSGNNTAGSVLKIQGGASTGTAAGGNIEFYTTAAAEAGGNGVNAQVKALSIASDKSATFEGAVTIKGNLDIQNTGTLTTIDTTNLSVTDTVIELASNADQAVTNDDIDTGIVFTRGSDVHPAVFFWDEDDDKFVLATKQGASTSTTNFSADNAPVEAQLDVGTLNADIVLLDSADATSLVFKESDNTAFLTLDTQNDKVILNQQATLQSGSTVGTLTLSDGSITASGGSIDFDNENLSTSGNLTINTDKFAAAGATGIITLASGATIDNNTTATDLIITENNVVLPSGSLIFGAETDDGSTYTIAGRTTVVDGEGAHRAGGDLVLRGAVGSNAGTNDGSVYIDSGAGRVASFDRANLKTTLHGTVEIGTSLDMTDGAITNVTDIALDSITADDANTITVNIKQAGGASAFVIKDNDAGAAIEHIKIDATNDGDKTTIGSASLDINSITRIDNAVTINHSHAAVDFRVASDNLTHAIFVDGSDDKVGIGDNAPGTLLQVSGTTAQLPYLTLKNVTAENGAGEAATKIIFEDHGNNTLGEIEVSHQGTDDDEFGQMIFKTNNDSGAQTALVIDKDQVANFKQDVVIEGGDNAAVLTLGKNQAQDSEITVAARTGDNDGQNLTISAGDAANSDDNLGGDLILASGNGVTNGGTSTIQFQTKVTGTAGVSEAMRIHSNGYLGIGDNAPETILHLKGSTTATTTLTLESSADVDQNAQDEGATILAFKGSETLAFAQIVGAHDGTGDDDKGTLIFNTNNDTALTEALRIDSSQNATFAGDVTIKNDLATAHAVLSLISDVGGENGDTWKLDAADDSPTLTIFNNVNNGNDVAQLTLVGNATATDGLATFAGDITTNGDVLTVNGVTLTSDGTDFSTSGDLNVNGGVASVVAPDATSSEFHLKASLGTANGDSWKFVATDENTRTLTISGQNANNANYGNVLVLKADNTLTDSLATFGGNVKVGGDNIQDSAGTASITFSGDSATTTLTATKTIVSNNLQVNGTEIDVDVAGALNIGATVGANSITLGVATSTIVSAGNLQVNGDITGDGDEAKTIFAATTTEAQLITLGGGGTVKTAGKLRVTGNHIEDSGNATAIQFDGSQNTTIKGNLTIQGLLTGSSTTGHVSFKDRILALATSNASSSNPVGFYGLYRDTNDAEYYNGLLYAPDSTAGGTLGSWKLFHTNQTIEDDQDINITITDAQLGILDINTVRGGSAKGNDNTAGTDLTISGGLSTGNATGGTIVFKTGGTGGAGSSVNSATTALTIDADQKTTLNVAGAGLDITKSTATHTEGNNGDAVEELSSRAISLTYTFNDILADAATSETITVLTDKASLTSVVIGTSSLDATVEVFGVSATGFKFRFTNISGGNFAAASDGKFNFVII